jgi:predicted flap endonuclease-1-like 5' DNA nuclease
MRNQFHIKLENYSLEKFKKSLQRREMIPSRMILKEDIEERFAKLEKRQLSNLKELTDRLKTKSKIEEFSKDAGLSIEYLTILNREAKSYIPKPTRIDKYAGIERNHIKRLDSAGIKNTRHILDQAGEKDKREELTQKTGLPIEALNEIVCLADLSRVYGVGPAFARMIYDMGIRTIQEFVEKTAEDFIEIYEEKTKKKADFGTNEIQFSIELAKDLDILVEL